MAAQWKPGDLALLLCSDGQWRLGFYSLRTGASNSARLRAWVFGNGGARRAENISDARRPAVLDPESAKDAERLARLIGRELGVGTYTAEVQQALRAFANPEPEIEEPRGLGAVVEDADGALWVRTDAGEFNKPWYRGDTIGLHAHWSRVKAGRILSPGVEES